MMLIYAAATTSLFSILQSSPKRAVFISGVIGAAGYGIYYFLAGFANMQLTAYFVSAFFIAVGGEIASRVKKMPSIVFISPSFVPIVPGLGLFDTLFMLVNGQYTEAVQTGANTMMAIVMMAMAVAVVALVVKMVYGGNSNTIS